MVKADVIHALLMRLETMSKGRPHDEYLEITLNLLERSELSPEEGYAALRVLSTREGYKCLDMKYFPELEISRDGFETFNLMSLVRLLPDFIDTWEAFMSYYQYRRYIKSQSAKDNREANINFYKSRFPENDFGAYEKRFETNEPDIDWSPKEYPSEDDWLKDIRLSIENYNKATGSLELMPGKAVSIPRKGKVKKSTGAKYFECKVMEKLFDSKTTLSNGVSFHSLLGIHQNVALKESDVKKVTNVRTAINKKLSEETGLKKLIIIRRNKAYINHLYLLKD